MGDNIIVGDGSKERVGGVLKFGRWEGLGSKEKFVIYCQWYQI